VSDSAGARELFLPRSGDPSVTSLRRWFDNVPLELRLLRLDEADRARFESYYTEAGLLRRWRRPFFQRHYAETLAAAVAFLIDGRDAPRILDLGCGTGTQSLYLALQGARVLAVDMDASALRVFRARKALFEAHAGRSLSIEILEESVFAVEYRAHGSIDGVYSMFAFNMMQPSERLIDAVLPALAAEARWAVLDGNRVSVWARCAPWRRRRVWSPAQMRDELERRGFRVQSQRGGIALPPILWSVLPYAVARGVDACLCSGTFWPVSYQTLAVRVPAGGRAEALG
jgi:SAM-dependent methyltransferase